MGKNITSADCFRNVAGLTEDEDQQRKLLNAANASDTGNHDLNPEALEICSEILKRPRVTYQDLLNN